MGSNKVLAQVELMPKDELLDILRHQVEVAGYSYQKAKSPANKRIHKRALQMWSSMIYYINPEEVQNGV